MTLIIIYLTGKIIHYGARKFQLLTSMAAMNEGPSCHSHRSSGVIRPSEETAVAS
ncbi:MAG: hypothetical protein WA874_19160 [Chryseosolibacter sp.]